MTISIYDNNRFGNFMYLASKMLEYLMFYLYTGSKILHDLTLFNIA